MLKLSVSMIVKNEEICLAKCLESVRGADELIVVDTGSTDKTKEIALSYGAKVFDFPWVDDFAAARNESLKHCTGDWVLSIDADNELEPNGIEKIRVAAGVADAVGKRGIGIKVLYPAHGNWHHFPHVFKRCPEVQWKGAIHNHLTNAHNDPVDVTIFATISVAHKKDPDRALRILKKEVKKNPKTTREVYYLAREYFYRKDYVTAAYWYEDYLTRGTFPAEVSDAYLMLARCYWQLHKGEKARDMCLQAIKWNNDFKEALLFMAEMSGPKNKERWKLFAEMAEDEGVLFVRKPVVKGAAYYDKLFGASRDMSRYEKILKEAASWSHGKVLDICCGTGELSKYVADYQGIDFSAGAIGSNPKLRQADVFKEDYQGYDTYVILEALEHLDDIALLKRLPPDADLVFSVPSFPDPSHVRTFNEKLIRYRFAELLKVERIKRYNWNGKAWDPDHKPTEHYILLVKARTWPKR